MDVRIVDGYANHYKEAENTHVLAFGRIQENGSAIVKIKIEGDIEDSSLQTTCGCTATESDEKNVYTINYKNTNIIAPFAKVLILTYIEGGNKKQSHIKITGNVIK